MRRLPPIAAALFLIACGEDIPVENLVFRCEGPGVCGPDMLCHPVARVCVPRDRACDSVEGVSPGSAAWEAAKFSDTPACGAPATAASSLSAE